ncbi:ABC transporter substrate-binding protein [Mesorhizobium sp.]|uniref:ABC transporter substrate-binding protein n=1 Tax=Mesorhizobium sp. TaxID=1871066 RepID=UPI0025EA726A|nr:ABC transporter substrate-binding protein [Mesorhizobium sp.]
MAQTSQAAISRRQFGRMAATLGAGAALLPFVGGVARAESKRGGRLRIGANGSNASESWDPATWGVSIIMGLGGFGCIYNNLVEIGSDGVLKPELAESYEAAPDAKTWTFKLRSGVTFSNGKTLTADDVVASINHHRGPDSKSSAKPIVEGIANIKSDGSNTVVVELSSGNADFAYLLSDYHLVIGPADNGKVDWMAHIGTGGYTVAEYDVGNRLLLKRRDGYWKPNAAWFDEVEIIGIDDVAARMNAASSTLADISAQSLRALSAGRSNPSSAAMTASSRKKAA